MRFVAVLASVAALATSAAAAGPPPPPSGKYNDKSDDKSDDKYKQPEGKSDHDDKYEYDHTTVIYGDYTTYCPVSL